MTASIQAKMQAQTLEPAPVEYPEPLVQHDTVEPSQQGDPTPYQQAPLVSGKYKYRYQHAPGSNPDSMSSILKQHEVKHIAHKPPLQRKLKQQQPISTPPTQVSHPRAKGSFLA